MNIKSYITITAAVFSAVALLHLMRIILGESVIIGGWDLPGSFNWVGMVIRRKVDHKLTQCPPQNFDIGFKRFRF